MIQRLCVMKLKESYKGDEEAKLYDKTNFNGKKETYKMQKFYILLVFSLITVVAVFDSS